MHQVFTMVGSPYAVIDGNFTVDAVTSAVAFFLSRAAKISQLETIDGKPVNEKLMAALKELPDDEEEAKDVDEKVLNMLSDLDAEYEDASIVQEAHAKAEQAAETKKPGKAKAKPGDTRRNGSSVPMGGYN